MQAENCQILIDDLDGLLEMVNQVHVDQFTQSLKMATLRAQLQLRTTDEVMQGYGRFHTLLQHCVPLNSYRNNLLDPFLSEVFDSVYTEVANLEQNPLSVSEGERVTALSIGDRYNRVNVTLILTRTPLGWRLRATATRLMGVGVALEIVSDSKFLNR